MLVKISSSTSTMDRDICIAFAYLPPGDLVTVIMIVSLRLNSIVALY